MPGPYFSGQQPSPCGHYYPDVLRLRDEKRPDGTFVRITDCRYCGRVEAPLEVRGLEPALARQLKKKGFALGVPEEQLAEFRKQELERLSAAADHNPPRALQMLQSILSEAIQAGADAVELEYVDQGLQVTAMFGDSGLGWVLADRVRAAEMIHLIVERARLQNKARGVMDWVHGGRPYRINVEEYENFGESAFRLVLGKSSRKRA